MIEQIEPLKYKAVQFSHGAMAVRVTSQADLEKANNLRQTAKMIIKMINEFFSPMHVKAKESVNEIKAKWDDHLRPVESADLYLRNEMSVYVAKVEKEGLEAEEKIRAAAEAEVKRKAEEEAQLQAALKAEEEGRKEDAEKIIEKAAKEIAPSQPPPPLPPPSPKFKGMQIRHDWKWRAIDESAVPRLFLMLDGAKITRYVKEHKDKAQIPGIEVYLETGVATRDIN